jgi:hypothetical protein
MSVQSFVFFCSMLFSYVLLFLAYVLSYYVLACYQQTTWPCLLSHQTIRLSSIIIGGFHDHYRLLFALLSVRSCTSPVYNGSIITRSLNES